MYQFLFLLLGGWTAGSKEFSEMAADPARRAVFIDSVVAFMQKFGFEGLDFDWEYPGFFDGSDPENDRDNFSQLVKEIAETLHPLGYILTAAVSPGYEKVLDWLDVSSHDSSMTLLSKGSHRLRLARAEQAL